MAASGKKKGKLKGKTLNLNEFLSNDSGGGGGSPAPSYTYKSGNSWADEIDDMEDHGGSSAWPDSDVYTKPAIDRSRLPTAPRSSRPADIDPTRLPSAPPYTAFLGNLPYDCEKEDIFEFFRNLNVTEVRLPRDGGGEDGRLKGFGYAEFEDVASLLEGLALNNEMLKNRRLRVDIAGQSQEKGDGPGGRDQGPDRTECDWRRPAADDAPPPVSSRDDRYRDARAEYGGSGFDRDRNDRGYGDRQGYGRDDRSYGDRGSYGRDDRSYGSDRSYGDRDRGYGDRGYGDRDRGYGDRDRGYGDRDRYGGDRDRGYGGGRRTFGSGYRDEGGYGRDRGGYERRDQYDRDGDRYGDREQGQSDPPRERRKLQLQPRTQPVENKTSAPAPPPAKSSGSSIFGDAKPVDTATREREIEEKLKEKQHFIEEQLQNEREKQDTRKDSWREGRQRRDSDRSNEGRDGSSRSRHGSSGSGRGGPRPVMHTRRDSERSDDGVFREDKEPDAGSPRQDEAKKNVVPAPPPKENPWTRKSHSSEPKSPTSSISPERNRKLSSETTPPRDMKDKKDYVDAPPPKENIWAKRSASRTSPGEQANDRGGGQRRGGSNDNRNYRDYKDRRKDEPRQDSRPKGSQGSKDRRPQEPREMPKYEEPAPPTWGTQSKFALLGDEGDDEDVNVSD